MWHSQSNSKAGNDPTIQTQLTIPQFFRIYIKPLLLCFLKKTYKRKKLTRSKRLKYKLLIGVILRFLVRHKINLFNLLIFSDCNFSIYRLVVIFCIYFHECFFLRKHACSRDFGNRDMETPKQRNNQRNSIMQIALFSIPWVDRADHYFLRLFLCLLHRKTHSLTNTHTNHQKPGKICISLYIHILESLVQKWRYFRKDDMPPDLVGY